MKANETLKSEVTMLPSTINVLLEHIELLKKEIYDLRTAGPTPDGKTFRSNIPGNIPDTKASPNTFHEHVKKLAAAGDEEAKKIASELDILKKEMIKKQLNSN